MKTIIALLLAFLMLSAVAAEARSTRVKPHVRKDGTFVPGHRRTTPDSSKFNNYSTKGNSNPYTGEKGTVDPFAPKVRRSR